MSEWSDAYDFVVGDDGVAVHGEIDDDAVLALYAVVAGLDHEHFELDLSRVTFIDSSGVRALLLLLPDHPTMRVVNPSANALALFDLLGVTDHLLGP